MAAAVLVGAVVLAGFLLGRPRPPTPEAVREYLSATAGEKSVPLPEVPFWDVPALATVALFVFAGATLSSRRCRSYVLAGAPAVPSNLFDLVGIPPVPPALVDASTQTVPEWPSSGEFSNLDDWVSLPQPPPSPPLPPVLGPAASHFVSLPWGWVFLGGAVGMGLYLWWPHLRRSPRRSLVLRRGDLPREVLFSLTPAFWGGVLAVGSFWFVGHLGGWIPGPTRVGRDVSTYLLQLFVPGHRGSVFSFFGAVSDLADRSFLDDTRFELVLFSRVPPRLRRPALLVLWGVTALVVFQHVVAVLGGWSDLEQLRHLVQQDHDLCVRALRLVERRVAHLADHPHPNGLVNDELARANHLLLRLARVRYESICNYLEVANRACHDLNGDSGVPHREHTLVTRAARQVGRLVSWVIPK